MKGAREYANLFSKAVQIGRLYILPHYHARGKTFRIYVLPEGESVVENAGINPPLNAESVEVYGIVGGNPGWTESYGWIHRGKWQDDFNRIVAEKVLQKEEDEANAQVKYFNNLKDKDNHIKSLLDSY